MGIVFMVLFWALLIGGIALLVKWIADSGSSAYGRTRSEESAVEILKRRYASGEITKTEYEQMKRELS